MPKVDVDGKIMDLKGKPVQEVTENAKFECLSELCGYEFEGTASACRLCGRGANVCPLCGGEARVVSPPMREDVTIKSVCVAALMQPAGRNEKIGWKKVLKRKALMEKIDEATGMIAVDNAEVGTLVKLIESVPYSQYVKAEAIKVLDPEAYERALKETDDADVGDPDPAPPACESCEGE